jgi:hypothetical protein
MSADNHARTMLPIPDQPRAWLDDLRREGTPHRVPPIEPLLPPEGAPSVLRPKTTDVGHEAGTTVTADYSARDSRFNGKIHWGCNSTPKPTTTTSTPRNA